MRYFLHIAYKGTAYHGWQIQPNGVTVQEVVNDRLCKMLRLPMVETLGCGRTDTGVHATSFYLHFDYEGILAEDFVFRMNAFLPDDIALFEAIPLYNDAHARFDATMREYKFHISTKKDPFSMDTTWLHTRPLDLDLMNFAAGMLRYHNDFACFARTGGNNKTTLCKVSYAKWKQSGHHLVFTIRADRFLRNMVRAIVGTLTEVGRREMTLEQWKNLLDNGTRSDAGTSAPAHGLYLSRIEYPYLKHGL